ncbi:MAG: polyprenol monophosphomannose synthase [Candidatus Aureabacteria bacterium]|nr:polyprenol monophosphomannose synthase [Candidatus Auribacterota bacterium]
MKTIVVIPTYNEAQNIMPLLAEVLKQPGDLEALVVDDDSPDGTWKLVEEAQVKNPRVHLLLRREKRGRGLAGLDGFKKALAMGADRIVEMDADFSHDPAYLPALLEASESADLVIGSRYVPGGSDEERGLARRAVSSLARQYLKWILWIPVCDPTSGYRCFRREALSSLMAEEIRASDPFIITEILFRSKRKGLSIAEVPIVFRVRRAGSSKLNALTLVKYCFKAMTLRLSEFKRGGGSAAA